jgi:glycerol-3-phosphate dehydrogenase
MAADVLQRARASGDLPPPPSGAADTRLARLVGAPAAGAAMHSLQAAPGAHLWGSEAPVLQTLPGADRFVAEGLTEAMVRFAARHEWAITVEDMLARRWRLLFLDAQAAAQAAPEVARLLREETGIDPRLDDFKRLCDRYRLPIDWTFEALTQETLS